MNRCININRNYAERTSTNHFTLVKCIYTGTKKKCDFIPHVSDCLERNFSPMTKFSSYVVGKLTLTSHCIRF